MSYFSHDVRGAGLEEAMMLGMGGGGSRGRPSARWADEITATADMTFQEAVAAPRDRVGWRLLVKSVARVRIGSVLDYRGDRGISPALHIVDTGTITGLHIVSPPP